MEKIDNTIIKKKMLKSYLKNFYVPVSQDIRDYFQKKIKRGKNLLIRGDYNFYNIFGAWYLMNGKKYNYDSITASELVDICFERNENYSIRGFRKELLFILFSFCEIENRLIWESIANIVEYRKRENLITIFFCSSDNIKNEFLKKIGGLKDFYEIIELERKIKIK